MCKKKGGCSDFNLFPHFLRTQKFVPQKSTLLMHCFFYLDTRGPKLGANKSLSWKQGCQFRTLAYNAAEITTAKMITVLFRFFCFLVLFFDSAKRSYKILYCVESWSKILSHGENAVQKRFQNHKARFPYLVKMQNRNAFKIQPGVLNVTKT